MISWQILRSECLKMFSVISLWTQRALTAMRADKSHRQSSVRRLTHRMSATSRRRPRIVVLHSTPWFHAPRARLGVWALMIPRQRWPTFRSLSKSLSTTAYSTRRRRTSFFCQRLHGDPYSWAFGSSLLSVICRTLPVYRRSSVLESRAATTCCIS